MKLGLSLALTGVREAGESPAFTPAMLPLTGCWQASYTASPWLGAATSGTSGGRNLSEASVPAIAGSAVNGLTPAHFTYGGAETLGSGVGISSYLSSSAWSIAAVVRCVDTDFLELFIDNAGGLEIQAGFNAGVGFFVAAYMNGAAVTVDGALDAGAADGALAIVHVWYDGASVNVDINDGAGTDSGALAAQAIDATSFAVGAGGSQGDVFELLVARTNLGPAARSNISAYFADRYGL